MVGSTRDGRTDGELIEYLKEMFGTMWFSCRQSKLSKHVLTDLFNKKLIDRSRETYTHTIYYRVIP